MQGATLDEASLGETHFENTFLQKTSLRKINFRESYLDNANMPWAQVEGSSFVGVHGLTQEQLDMTIGDGTTRTALKRPASWKK